MRLFDTKTQAVQEFAPRGREVTLYVCGITPYDTTHLGHAFTYVAYDHLIRYLEMQGLSVRYTQNVTDIDDDILKRARENGTGWRELGIEWTNHFINDMIALNVRPPDAYPRATEVIPEIIQSVEALLKAGVAYAKNGSVYYQVSRYPAFGQLSHLPQGEMLEVANERGNHPDDPNKRDPLDFVLWQAQAPGEPAWHSPWGPGRPGWHIECSTMATKFLGETVDIHGGGLDLCFPHHECEIAQVAPVRDGDPYVRTWMHTAMVRYQGEKMSKSLGNLVMVSDLLKTYAPDAIRLYLASHHYRESWSYEENDLRKFAGLAGRLRQAASAGKGAGAALDGAPDPGPFEQAFVEAMENDLDTPAALRALTGLADEVLRPGGGRRDATAGQAALLLKLARVFGLSLGREPLDEQTAAGWNRQKR